MRILVVNAGSTTLKLSLLDDDKVLASRQVEVSDAESGQRALEEALEELQTPEAVGHRVVHGGPAYTHAVRIDQGVRDRLEEYVGLAPLHQPAALAGIDLVSRALPDVPVVACFDTAFHATMPPAASTYAVPAEWREEYGLRKYGFHGLSHAYAARRAAEMVGRPIEELRTVVCHLGAGASVTAVRAGRSVDTTMGFTPLAGLVMASRSGDVDPGLLVWLLRNRVVDAEELDTALERHSGLVGLAGTGDMRIVLDDAAAGDPRARLAVEVYLHRLRAQIAAMTASLGGLDVLAFTGGVGEHAAPIRDGAVRGLGYLGIEVDPDRNAEADGDTDISALACAVRTLVVTAREDLEIAAEVRRVCAPEDR
ncbi:acetate/propionate family kinase [Actinopolymorpha pittospori]|uniref:Acetate kinase n=1 Tax=Actinopolymorpha pittospori TaxID=648752 RepID=A0A927REX1_9ACTN|nr:acetate/propionate family kinase [Actinopolymorpha pittospori]MBE1609615.1 acetate kinase [Actinopolymorpha pittospori]